MTDRVARTEILVLSNPVTSLKQSTKLGGNDNNFFIVILFTLQNTIFPSKLIIKIKLLCIFADNDYTYIDYNY